MLDLKDLERRVDAALAKETPESLKAFLEKCRNRDLQAAVENAIEEYSFQVPYDGTQDFYNETKAKDFRAGVYWLLDYLVAEKQPNETISATISPNGVQDKGATNKTA